uniref:HDC16228 n=1 Tax=Drosophila melanogaster TaxID=7227 RepID=Q6IJ04_DROME|nr:TPA_inf: HDC16228 [Drosophila melanogaster]
MCPQGPQGHPTCVVGTRDALKLETETGTHKWTKSVRVQISLYQAIAYLSYTAQLLSERVSKKHRARIQIASMVLRATRTIEQLQLEIQLRCPLSTIHCPVTSVQLQLSFAIAVSSFSSDTNGRGAAKRWRLCAMSISSYGMTLYVRRARSLSLSLSSSYSLRFRFFLASDSDSELATGRQNRNPCAKCNQCKAESQRKPATMNGQRS